MNFDELKSRDISELRLLAAQRDIRAHPRMKAETLAKLIVEASTKPHVAPTVDSTVKTTLPIASTEEQVRGVISDLLAMPGFTAKFPGDGTWIFTYRRPGHSQSAEESGHLTVPLRWINIKARQVAKGVSLPRGLKDQQLNNTPNSGTVLMV